MIYDKISNIQSYMGINDNLDAAIKEIRNGSYVDWKPGHHEIDGKNVFCNRVHLETKENAPWERHDSYLDIHVVMDGSEKLRYLMRDLVSEWSEFDVGNDCSLAPYTENGINFTLEPGWFFIAFPQDAHMPGLRYNTGFSEKAIFKVRIK